MTSPLPPPPIDRSQQQRWAAMPLGDRLRVLVKARHLIALAPARLFPAAHTAPGGLPLSSLTSELLPLLAAIRFLETSAGRILKTRRLGGKGLPFWLRGLHTEVRRVAFGTVLVIGPSNYPLLLPGLQAVQALVAGNAVIWKPGLGGRVTAEAFAAVLAEAGLPAGLLAVTAETVAAAEEAIDAGVDKVFLTGSAASGRALLHRLADRLVPAVVELSGCDAVMVLPGADYNRVVRAVTFGLRLNGSSTCMAPRRILLVGATPAQSASFARALAQALLQVTPVELPVAIRARLTQLLGEAQRDGAVVVGDVSGSTVRPVLVDHGSPDMAIAQEDIFAPVVTLISVRDKNALLAAQARCPFALTASIFGPEAECRQLACELEVGSVFINDLIFPSADPRAPFGGRRLSGFGVTQGAEGLLEMTAVKTVVTQRSADLRHYEPSKPEHLDFFLGIIRSMYSNGLRHRLRGIVQTVKEGRRMRQSEPKS